MKWGLLGPETLVSQRRVRTLGLATVVRKFNDLAAPGMGGVWFAKQLLLAIAGIALAEATRESGRQFRNIEVANAVEALACWLTLSQSGWEQDPRLLGRVKMRGKEKLPFQTARQAGFYVTQPMRMRTVQPLLALGLVEGASERFNAYKCTDLARALMDAAWKDLKPNNRTVMSNLFNWAEGDDDCVDTDRSRRALSPTETPNRATCEILREVLVTGSSRRHALLGWMERLRKSRDRRITWQRRPAEIESDHWRDIEVGARFFVVRDAAIDLLDTIEILIGPSSERRLLLTRPLPNKIEKKLASLRVAARSFLDDGYDPSPDNLATIFCKECVQQDSRAILRSVVTRDGRVLQMRGDTIAPGPAFRGVDQTANDEVGGDNEDAGVATDIQWPAGISVRVENLFFLNADLSGQLPKWVS